MKENIKYKIEIGDLVYKKTTDKVLGIVSDIKQNPQHPNNKLSVTIEGRDEKSLYIMDSLYAIRNND